MVLPGLKTPYLLPGGLGFRSMVQLAPSCFISSAAASSGLVSLILSQVSVPPYSLIEEARLLWCHRAPSASPPSGEEESSQKLDSLIASTSDDSTVARLLAVSSQGSGAWLNAVPITSLGLCLDDNAVHIAAATHLGLPVCSPHLCRNCGASVDQFGLHGLHCKKSGSRFLRHASLNDVLKRSFSAVGIPSSLEPSGLSRSDGKCRHANPMEARETSSVGCHCARHLSPLLPVYCCD